jgi:spore coat polysaccharide biosynthesis protein SpsF
MKVVAVIQARMGSTRLRGKSLMKLSNFTLLETVIRSIKRNDFIDDFVVATSNLPEDDEIEELCNVNRFKLYRGDSDNVLSRFIAVAETLDSEDTLVRVTADNPINNTNATKKVFQHHVANKNDYTYIKGLSHTVYEFINVKALLSLSLIEDLTADDREHVTKYIRERSELFKISEISPNSLGIKTDLDKLLTVDTKEDYQRFMSIKYKIDLDNTIDMSVLYKLMLSKY